MSQDPFARPNDNLQGDSWLKPVSPEPALPTSTDSSDSSPFSIPEDFQLPPYLTRETPRPLTEEIRNGRVLRQQRANVWITLALAGACWLTAPLPFVREMSWYLIPLGWLNWIGGGLALLAIYISIKNRFGKSLTRYAVHGVPEVVRVKDTGIVTTASNTQGVPPSFFFCAEVESPHPTTGSLVSRTVVADYSRPIDLLNQYDSGINVGDYTTIVSLPEDATAAPKLWGWTGLDANCDLIQHKGRPLKVYGVVYGLTVTAIVIFAFWMLIGFIYVFGAYSPTELNFPLFLTTTAIVAAVAILLWEWNLRRDSTRVATAKVRLFSWGIATLLSGAIAFIGLALVNGFSDTSPYHLQPIFVTKRTHTTYNFVVRYYEMNYLTLPNRTAGERMVSVETVDALPDESLGVIDYGEGRLGMKWIRGIYPVSWKPLADVDRTTAGGLTVTDKEQGGEFTIVPAITPREGVDLPVPDIIRDDAARKMAAVLNQSGRFTAVINGTAPPANPPKPF